MKTPDPAADIPVHCAHAAIVDWSTLRPHPRNPNRHPSEQIALLAKNIRALGWRHPVIVSKLSGYIVAGHARIEAAKLLNINAVPVDYQPFANTDEETAYLIADNRIAELAERDNAVLKDLLQELDTGATDMDLTGYTEQALEELMLQTHQEEDADAEPQTDRAEELRVKWGVQTGDLWLIGDHRLLCGDSTSEADVARLLGDREPLLMVTDPPYGVEYDAGWRQKAGIKHCENNSVGAVTNDDRADWREAWALFPGDVAYVWHAGNMAHVVAESLLSCELLIRAQIIWTKNQGVISRGDYHPQHEPCWYCVRKGKPGLRTDDRTQTTVWPIQKPQKKDTGHSTQKPLECMARPMRNHNAPEVYDPFLGSGTTMVAAQNLGRKCYGLEIAPGYCGVILERMATAFPGIEIRKAE